MSTREAEETAKLQALRAAAEAGIAAIERGDFRAFDSMDELAAHLEKVAGEAICDATHGPRSRSVRAKDDADAERMIKKVFIGGSRKISRLGPDVQRRLDCIIDNNLPVLIGDATGADMAVQQYLHDRNYKPVEVFCAGGECRNNIGGWPVRTISTNGRRKDFGFYAAKDQAMAAEASIGFMIWDGQSVGTLMNAYCLVQQGKSVVAYLAPSAMFVDLKSRSDWDQLISSCDWDVRRRVERETVAEAPEMPSAAQASRL